VFQGISYLISESKTYHNLPNSFMYIGQGRIGGWLPINVVIMVVLILIVGFVMGCTGIGRKVYAAGDSPEAARLAGLPVAKIKVLSFTCAGILVGIAAVLLASRSGSSIAAHISSIGRKSYRMAYSLPPISKAFGSV
jgi:ribose/xylose/arabinose/galactoside ABC-type transport system permease subunit